MRLLDFCCRASALANGPIGVDAGHRRVNLKGFVLGCVNGRIRAITRLQVDEISLLVHVKLNSEIRLLSMFRDIHTEKVQNPSRVAAQEAVAVSPHGALPHGALPAQRLPARPRSVGRCTLTSPF